MKLILALAGLAMAASVTFKNKTIDYPADPPGLPDRFELVTQNCTGCHSSEFLTAQPKLSRATWAAEVAKMRRVYKAPIEPGDDAKLVEALVALQGG
ncbi:MAG: cytochrome C nitrite reductase [Sphingomonas sp.]|jgi:hypothetical protein|uniref:cytochrome C nitrite reductase n=1 Tax=Sphingomonas sp. TaxID=28214 RepID=UPI0025F1F1F5|nr:cytochrome C nitrite reductase [Sphingomonas sp.]MBX9881357.1 cytochrome C nitrite reductase [Sphingomonas sp.]